jgi:predicted AAA+ superfamily ATPase
MVRQLPPWHENLAKRQVKAPKVYISDSGLLHALLGVKTEADLLSHLGCGASWEGFAIGEALRDVRPDEAFFWATHGGAELDLFLLNGLSISLRLPRRPEQPLSRPEATAQARQKAQAKAPGAKGRLLRGGVRRPTLRARQRCVPE